MEPSCKRTIENRSLKSRASKLFNALSEAAVLPYNIMGSNENVKKFKDTFLVNNYDIVKYIFEYFFLGKRKNRPPWINAIRHLLWECDFCEKKI